MYADDSILYTSGNEWDRMILKVQLEIDSIQNRLKLNIKNSKTLVYGSRNKSGKIHYTNKLYIDGIALDFVDKYKYLGVTLDKEITLNGLFL